jgi:hypothetical protein
MSIALIVTRGYGNGALVGTIKDVVLRGYGISDNPSYPWDQNSDIDNTWNALAVSKLIKTDTFTEAEITPLEDHVSDSGGGWKGGSTASISVDASGEAYAEGALTYAGIGDENPASANQQCTVVGRVNIEQGFGAIVRGGSDDSGYRGYIQSLGDCILAKYGPPFIILDTVPIPGFALLAYYAVTVQAIDNTIKVFVDDVELISVEDSDITAAGNIGIYLRQDDARITSITAIEFKPSWNKNSNLDNTWTQ